MSCTCPSTFFGSTGTISRFGERFRDGQYSLVSFLFGVLLTLPLPREQPFVKVKGTCPLCPIESAPLATTPSRDTTIPVQDELYTASVSSKISMELRPVQRK